MEFLISKPGCKPIPRSFSDWNFDQLDPDSAVRAAAILSKTAADSRTIDSSTLNTSHSKTTRSISKYTASESQPSVPSSSYPKSFSAIRSTTNEATNSCLPLDSHPLCASHNINMSLFNLNGHSPLIEFFFYSHKARKVNKPDVLVQHASVVDLPPLDSIKYNDVIRSSLTAIKKIEKELKVVQNRQESQMLKMKASRIKSMKEYKRNQELMLAKHDQVKILSELIAMSKHVSAIMVI